MYFEALTGTSIPTRLAEVTLREEGQEASDAVVELGFEEQQRRAEESLTSLADAFEGGWSAVTVDAESDDYFVSERPWEGGPDVPRIRETFLSLQRQVREYPPQIYPD